MSNNPLYAVYQKMLALQEFASASANDVVESSRILAANPQSQFWRRVLVRNFAAHVEGLVYLLKMLSLDLQKVMNVTFTDEEQDRLREFSSKANEKGEIVQKSLFMKFQDNFKFAYDCFARANHSSFKLTFDAGYDCFRKMVKIRDRLMHPKSVADLEVSDSQLQDVDKAWDWYQLQTGLLLRETLTALQEYERKVNMKPS